MHTLSEYEDAAYRVGRKIEDCLGKIRSESEREARAEHAYKVGLEESKAMLRVKNPTMPVRTQESEAFRDSQQEHLDWRVVAAELTTLKLELRAYMAKLDVLRSLMSAHRAEAEFVRKER